MRCSPDASTPRQVCFYSSLLSFHIFYLHFSHIDVWLKHEMFYIPQSVICALIQRYIVHASRAKLEDDEGNTIA